MPRLTKRDRETLRAALEALERGADYLAREDVAVAVHSSMSDTLVYRNEAGGPSLSVVNKDYGSPLTGFEDATRILGHFLATH